MDIIKLINELPRRIEYTENVIQSSAESLANFGWSLPAQFTPDQLNAILRTDCTESEVTEVLVEYFLDDNHKNLDELVKDHLLANENLAPWASTIEQCKKAFDEGLYFVVVPTLLSVVEGYLSKQIGTLNTPEVRVKAKTKAKSESAHKLRTTKTAWISVSAIVDDLYDKYEFSGNPPPRLNRHWVLHGRHTPLEAEADSVKLFNLLGTLSLADA